MSILRRSPTVADAGSLPGPGRGQRPDHRDPYKRLGFSPLRRNTLVGKRF